MIVLVRLKRIILRTTHSDCITGIRSNSQADVGNFWVTVYTLCLKKTGPLLRFEITPTNCA